VSQTARFSVHVDPLGYSTITVNDQDVTQHTQGFRVESAIGAPSVLTLFSSARGEIVGEGIVYVQPPSEDLAAFIEQLDPEEVEKKAIERSHMDPESSLTKLMLNVVADAARGKA
jgi:hypothetical protein